jgi:hypothetical protein
MEAAYQEPRPALRQRQGQAPQVDVVDAAAAGELILTIHVKTGQDMSHSPRGARATRPVGFRRAIAAAVLGVVDELMPFPAAAEPPGAAEQSFGGAKAQESASGAATAIPSATERGQVDQKTGFEVGAVVEEAQS